MSLPVIVRSLAERDLLEAQRWYDQRQAGLGGEFRASVDEILLLLSGSPRIFPVYHREIRQASLRRFPYLLYYAVQPERIVVLGCFHARRDPRVVLRRIG